MTLKEMFLLTLGLLYGLSLFGMIGAHRTRINQEIESIRLTEKIVSQEVSHAAHHAHRRRGN